MLLLGICTHKEQSVVIERSAASGNSNNNNNNNNNGLYLTRINTCVSTQAYLIWSSEGAISTVHC